MTWKYVMFDVKLAVDPRLAETRANPMTECKLPVLFPPEISHREISECVSRAIVRSEHGRKVLGVSAISAGFCDVTHNGKFVTQSQGSESTGLFPAPEDEKIINQVQGRNPFYYP